MTRKTDYGFGYEKVSVSVGSRGRGRGRYFILLFLLVLVLVLECRPIIPLAPDTRLRGRSRFGAAKARNLLVLRSL